MADQNMCLFLKKMEDRKYWNNEVLSHINSKELPQIDGDMLRTEVIGRIYVGTAKEKSYQVEILKLSFEVLNLFCILCEVSP